MEQTIKIVEMEVASGDLNILLQRYTMVQKILKYIIKKDIVDQGLN